MPDNLHFNNIAPQNDAGNASAMIIGTGMVGAGIVGVYVDYSKRFKEVVKILLVVGSAIVIAVCFRVISLIAGFTLFVVYFHHAAWTSQHDLHDLCYSGVQHVWCAPCCARALR